MKNIFTSGTAKSGINVKRLETDTMCERHENELPRTYWARYNDQIDRIESKLTRDDIYDPTVNPLFTDYGFSSWVPGYKFMDWFHFNLDASWQLIMVNMGMFIQATKYKGAKATDEQQCPEWLPGYLESAWNAGFWNAKICEDIAYQFREQE